MRPGRTKRPPRSITSAPSAERDAPTAAILPFVDEEISGKRVLRHGMDQSVFEKKHGCLLMQK
jgi:hypothetical protein